MTSKDFFISYTGADRAWAEWIADTLERAGYSTVLQEWDFGPGENFIHRMNQALGESRRVLAVMSPAYFYSEYARDEWTAALVRDRGQVDRLLLVQVIRSQPPPLLASRSYIDLVGLENGWPWNGCWPVLGQAVSGPLAGCHFRVVASSEAGGPGRFPGLQPAVFNVPPRNLNFTGRGELLQSMRRDLGEAAGSAGVRAAAVHGLGGWPRLSWRSSMLTASQRL